MTSPNLPEVTIATNGRERVEPPPNSVAELYRQALPALDFLTEQTKKDVALIVDSGDVHNVLATGMTYHRGPLSDPQADHGESSKEWLFLAEPCHS